MLEVAKLKNNIFNLMAWVIAISLIVTSVPWHNHEEGHEHEAELCDANNIHENDACHNFIYHGDRESGCEKHKHISEHEQSCLICHYHKSQQKLAFDIYESYSIVTVNGLKKSEVCQGHGELLNRAYPKRGPPPFA